MNDEKLEWITDSKQIPSASMESLKCSLLTCDGQGVKIKTVVLNELLSRAERGDILRKTMYVNP